MQVGGVRVAVAIVVVVGVGLVRDVAPHDRVVASGGQGLADREDESLAEGFHQQPSHSSAFLAVREVGSPGKSNSSVGHPRAGVVIT